MKCIINGCNENAIEYRVSGISFKRYCKKHYNYYRIRIKQPLVKKSETTEVMEINVDTIRELRNRGMGLEANKLINKYYESKRENRKQLEKELKSQEYQKKKVLEKCK